MKKLNEPNLGWSGFGHWSELESEPITGWQLVLFPIALAFAALTVAVL